MRSIWKGISLLKLSSKILKFSKIRLKNTRYKIISLYVGKTFEIYNGRKYIKIKVIKEMVGHFFGEFCFTRKIDPVHNKKKKLKKLKMMMAAKAKSKAKSKTKVVSKPKKKK